MSGTDDRVVNMQFDNAAFEKNLAQTQRSLETLQKSLDMQNASKGIDSVQEAASKFSMDHVTAGIEGVSTKFLALTTIGITALSKLTGAAIDAGKKVADAFIIDPAKQGFQEYETKIGSIQTILANTARYGTKLPEVADNLNKLNDYADKTIYSFGDMTKNIGLFTNAGIKVGDATSMIKGFSNAAAASGTTADGAAGAAYQLSQALSAGQIRLMDWRSLTNVGMGNKNMQDSLIQLAESMGVFNETGDNAKDVAKDFNGSLESGWLKADVMSKYLKIMSGEMSDAEIASLHLSKAQVEGFKAQQKTAEEAATKVRTFTQLVGTIKESVGSAWAQVFEDVVGDFTTATDLFTSVNNVVGGAVSKISNGVDNVLKTWAKLGGRTEFISALKDGFTALGNVMKAIHDAFREFFPAKTGKDLKEMTDTFAELTHWMVEQSKHLDGLKTIFRAFFAVIDIGWNILKQLYYTVLTILDIFKPLAGDAGNVTVKFAEWLLKLHEFLIEGGKLEEWGLKVRQSINKVADSLKEPIVWIQQLGDTLAKFWDSFGASKKAEDALDRVHDRFGWLKTVADAVEGAGSKIMDVLGKILVAIGNWFKELGSKIAAVLGPDDFNAAVDVVNVGLLGGILVALKKFLGNAKEEAKPGIFSKIKDSLDQLKGTLKAMETELKAKALLEIAFAIGVLTISIVALSLIDSDKLAAAMVAIGIGFGELIGVLKLLDEIGGGVKGAAKLDMLVGALIGVSGAAVILAGAVALMGQLSWDTILHGLVGLAGGLVVMIGALKLMSEGNISGVLLASAAMVAISTAMTILAGALKIFGTMSWEEMAKGLIMFAGAMTIIVVALNAMPIASTIAAGLAMIPLATGITIIAGALKIFATMSWEEIGKGLATLAGALAIIALAMQGMPYTLPITAAGLLLVGIALGVIAGVLKIMASMKFGDMAKALGELALTLGILAIGLTAMSGTIAGAVALGVAAVALGLMANVLKTLGSMDLKTIAIGLGAVIAVFAVIGISALVLEPVIPLIFLLGVALGTVGVAFALFGVGAFLIAKSFEAIAAAGRAGTSALIDSLMMIIKAIPKFVTALIGSMLDASTELLKSADLLLRIIAVLVGHILDTVIELLPKIAVVIVQIIDTILKILIDKGPDILDAGFKLLMMLLHGIIDHVVEVTTAILAIVVLIANTLTNNAQLLVNAAVNLLLAFLNAIANRIGDIESAALNILLHMIAAIAVNLWRIINLAGDIIAMLIRGLADNYIKIANAGVDAVTQFMDAIGRNVGKVVTKGADLIINLVQGITDNIHRVVDKTADIIIGFLNGMADTVRTKGPELRKAGENLIGAVIDGMTGGLASKIGGIGEKLTDGAKDGLKKLGGFLGIHSPSTRLYKVGQFMMAGWTNAIDDDTGTEASIVDKAQRIVDAFAETLNRIPDSLSGMDELNPVITPVLDLSKVQAEAGKISGLVSVPSISPDVSFAQARLISTTTPVKESTVEQSPTGPSEVTFEQNIYSPTPLSASDIYRQSKGLLATAKEELNI